MKMYEFTMKTTMINIIRLKADNPLIARDMMEASFERIREDGCHQEVLDMKEL